MEKLQQNIVEPSLNICILNNASPHLIRNKVSNATFLPQIDKHITTSNPTLKTKSVYKTNY